MFNPRRSYTFSDIGIVPDVLSNIKTRTEIDTSSDFLGIDLILPIASAPMEKVTGVDLAITLRDFNCLGFLPRSDSFEKDLFIFDEVAKETNKEVVVSIPVGGDALKRFDCLYEHGARWFCIDVANGFHVNIERVIKNLRKKTDSFYIITGNVASLEGYKWLKDLGVHAVRLGIGNGSVCTSSVVTAIGVGQASLIREIAEYKRDYGGPLIISDGGVKTPADVVKAVALGADIVVSGSLFAGTKESNNDVIKYKGILYKHYAGQASYYIKRNRNFIEGDDTLVPYVGPVERVLHQIEEGLKSGMAYLNCKTLEELKFLADKNFVVLSNSAKLERNVHANL